MGKLLHLTYSCIALGFALPMQAKVINTQQARAIAAKYISIAEQPKTFKAPGAKTADTPDFYAFNDSQGRGFVLIAGDDCLRPVLGYSHTGSIDTGNLPPAMKAWLDAVSESIAKARAEGGGIARTADEGDEGDDAPTVVVAPLIKTQWDQKAPYYYNTPTKSGTKTATGCIATAMAQVMNYYQWPEHGYGSVSYATPKYDQKTMNVDFTQSAYDWANMLDEYTYSGKTPDWNDAQGSAVAQLMADLGAAIHMEYGTLAEGGSGQYGANIAAAATYHFGYNVDMQFKNNYTIAQWTSLIKKCLDDKSPLVYCGASDAGGHCFVVDGYDSDNYLHVNWGWSGDGDGYFDFYNFGPLGYSFAQQMQYARLTPNRSGNITEAAQAVLGVDYAESKAYQDGTEVKNKLVTADADKLNADLDIMLYNLSWDSFKGNILLEAVPENGGEAKLMFSIDGTEIGSIQEEPHHFHFDSDKISTLADGRYTLRVSSQRTNNPIEGLDVPTCNAMNDAVYTPMLIKQDGKATVGFVNTHAPLLSQTGQLTFEKDEYDITDVAHFTVSMKNSSNIDSDQPLYLKIVGSDGKASYQQIANISLYAGDQGTLSKNVAIFGEGGFKPGTYQVSLAQAQNGRPVPLEGAEAATLKINRNDDKLPIIEIRDLKASINDEPLTSLDNITVGKDDDFHIEAILTSKIPAITPDTVNIQYMFMADVENIVDGVDKGIADGSIGRILDRESGYAEVEANPFFYDDLVGKTGYIYAVYRPMFDTELHFIQYNGKDLYIPFKIVDKSTAVSGITDNEKTRELMRFDTLGRRITSATKGINIVRMSDGTVRKIMVK